MGSSILRVPASGPLDVRFEHDPRQATKKNSQKGGFDFLHHVNGGAVIYLDPATHEAVIQSGAGAGDTVRLTKIRRGQTNAVDVELLSETPESTAPPQPMRPQSAPARTTEAVAPYVAGAAVPQTQPASPVEADGLHRPFAKEAVGAFLAAYDVLTYVERYSVAKGRPVVFTAEDYRATAISFHISLRGEKRHA